MSPDWLRTRVRFADFEVDFRSGELLKQGRRIRLQDQPLRVLGMLLEQPGEVVTREELRLQLWPADTFVDFDHGLNSAVARLRESLNDSADEPRYVETVPRRGYRFIGELQPIPKPEVPRATEEVSKPTHWRKLNPWVALASVLLVVLLVGLRTRGFSSKLGAPPLPPTEIVPLAGLAGYEVGPAFSPDGNQVAFVEINGRQNSGIYTSLVGGEESLRLTRSPADCCERWSPDGMQVAFLRRGNNQDEIYVVPALGGRERKVHATVRTLYPSLAWSPDGRFLAFPDSEPGNLGSWINLLSLIDSRTRPLTQPPPAYVDSGPAFSPDGSQVAFLRSTVAGVANDLFVVPAAGGQARRLTFDNRPIFGHTWTANGKELVYSSLRGGSAALWRVPAAGGMPQVVEGVGLMAFSPSISRRGNELAYQQAIGKDNVWRIGVKNGCHLAGPATIAIAAKGRKLRPAFSPDGTRIAFESDRLGSMEIWLCDSNGVNCTQLTSLHGTAGTAHWSPDGRNIAFEFHPGEHSEVYVVDAAGGVPRKIPTLPGADNLAPSWSRDGRWLYFSSKRGNERFQLWKVPREGGAPVEITKDGGIAGVESADGKYLYFSKYETNGIWRLPLKGGPEVRVLDKPDGIHWFNWALVGNGIYLLNARHESGATVEFFDFARRRVSHVWTLDKPWGWGLAVSPDEQSVLFVQSEFEESKIMVVKNFR